MTKHNNLNNTTSVDTNNSNNTAPIVNINTSDSTNQKNSKAINNNIIHDTVHQQYQPVSTVHSDSITTNTLSPSSPPSFTSSLFNNNSSSRGGSGGGFKLSTMTVWLTSECNLRCKYCFVYKLNEGQSLGKMSLETADQLVCFAGQYLQPQGTIWFFGAEPFCNFEVMKYIVEKSVKEGYKWRFGATTNATLLTREVVEWAKKYDFSVLCSIDGPKECHDVNRVYSDGKGSWDDAWQGLSNVREIFGLKNPQVRWTVTPSTVKGLAEHIRVFVEEHNIFSMPIDFVHETAWSQEDFCNLQVELEIFRGYYQKWMEQGVPVFSMWVRDANSAVTHRVRLWKSRCGLGSGSVGVDYDGTLYPCHRFIDSHVVKIGSVYAGFDEAQKEWEAKWLKVPPYCEAPKKCLSCSFKKACSGGCIAMNYDILGTVHAIPDTFCTIKQIITSTLGDLCKSLQNNKTFSNLYNSRNNVYQQGLSVVACQANNNLCSCQNKPTGQLKTNNSANTQTS